MRQHADLAGSDSSMSRPGNGRSGKDWKGVAWVRGRVEKRELRGCGDEKLKRRQRRIGVGLGKVLMP